MPNFQALPKSDSTFSLDKLVKEKDALLLKNCSHFDPALSCDCGQAFRWRCDENGRWHGIASGHRLSFQLTDNGDVRFYDTTEEEFCAFWVAYFDLNRDYETVCSRLKSDKALSDAILFCPGIHILRQDPWEALCSFILSQNNNIPRIKGIIERLCEHFGEKLAPSCFSFPSAERIASLSVTELSVLRAGFRAKYVLDAARKVTNGTVDFLKIERSDLETGREELKKIIGVGAKVAECVLLYGFGKMQAFPVDVWVRRIMAELYPNGLPACVRGNEGIAQQYLFHWKRNFQCKD
ncbi:MAG TPA: 8-oxoguanine DNA glycosylase [Ruminococcaceae bacterium]|nr:8-oxoguanine DNA glycosylase [Oscillospiraceae bacterium]